MVRFFNKSLRSHQSKDYNKISDLMSDETSLKLRELLKLHIKDFYSISPYEYEHLFEKLHVNIGINNLERFDKIYDNDFNMKDLSLIFDLILESYIRNWWMDGGYFIDFIDDINDFFIVEGISLQIRYIPNKREYFLEKIINDDVSKIIEKTLNKFEKEKKVFDDFKEVIKKFSIGEHKDSLRLCCIVLEDYFCVILNKDSCNNIEKYYKDVAKRLNINENLNNRFENIIRYIHRYRSIPSHGSKENKEIEDLELLDQTIIIFTMSILNYIKNKIEQTH